MRTKHAIKQSAKSHYIQTALNVTNQKAPSLMSNAKLNIYYTFQQAEKPTHFLSWLFSSSIFNSFSSSKEKKGVGEIK